MNNFWDIRFNQEDWVYGKNPNQFFKAQLDGLTPGYLLLPAEGEGRNAVYAASKGWTVWAFDSSEVAKNKALGLAGMNHLTLRYDVSSVEMFHPGEVGFDVIGIIFAHFTPDIRRSFFREIQDWLNPGGRIILEAFRKDQIHRDSGGPKNVDMLYSVDELRNDFNKLYIEQLTTDTVNLDEGEGHQGEAELIRFVGRK